MSRILVFQHVAAEPLGTLDPLIRRRGHRVKFVNFERQPEAKPRLDRYKGLIVLGGPMNVEDRAQRAHLQTEIDVIGEAVAQGKPVLGICLGAQLLAHVLGGEVRRHRVSEIGWYDLATTDAGRGDPVFAPLGEASPIFQWHGYTFDLPAGATHLARTATCENQAFRHGTNAYGFQFHLEMDKPLIERWLNLPSYRDELIAAGLGRDAETIRADTFARIDAMQGKAHEVFNNFLDLIGTPARRRKLATT
ncbi:MAG: gamma-glutamyl-gamma-aminobutyrate hydrolase family protein [Rudaea sp.]|uniref:type 1 glutamine amidotransferase n=1 Tax=unclassified Rudaea TaxID=2627037 RepID=UPI0010F63030|nr:MULTISPECIES: gamma-glutamyl-gamma-aminobutyrate hydrolase family protein [unclassified Rudaea]MBN8885523.1 gamma-glutamyl-gamma-aminobutyrate hydrolase family protein [Rudaea sp.]MBR0346498.1 gamma-glutamyl-gamma-aminobutyrate hydrolase family protein [Rudaea sp.]